MRVHTGACHLLVGVGEGDLHGPYNALEDPLEFVGEAGGALTQLQLVSKPVGRQVVVIDEGLEGRAKDEEEVFVEEGDFKVGAGKAGGEGEEEGGGGGGEEEPQVRSPFPDAPHAVFQLPGSLQGVLLLQAPHDVGEGARKSQAASNIAP